MPENEPTREEARLARLADGTLGPAERARAEHDTAHSAALAAAHAEQTRAVALLRRTDALAAPAGLRAGIETLAGDDGERGLRSDPLRRRFDRDRRRSTLLLPAATALVVLAVALVVARGGGDRPSVRDAARFALAPADTPAPAPAPGDRAVLTLRGAGLPFPSYVGSGGWQPVGSQRARLSGRELTAVDYRVGRSGRAGYTIVSGEPLAVPSGIVTTIAGTRYVLARLGSATLVTWTRAGHTCVIAARGLSQETLLRLAGAAQQVGA